MFLNSRYSGFYLIKYQGFFKVLILLFGLFTLNISSVFAQISIPRAGYPYCEPFTNSTARPNTIFGGTPTASLTGGLSDPDGAGVLRLTGNSNNERGYVFIDLPFSFTYGLKFSFEYFSYGGTTPGADGLSVFLFDGDVEAADFRIGGEGGSLSYAPLVVPPKNQLGLKGAYMGIGFDEFYNFGNNFEGKNGGFQDPTAIGIPLTAPSSAEFYNSVAVRGPETPGPGFLPYQFIDGRRVNNGPEVGDDPNIVLPNSAYLYPNLVDKPKRFPISTSSRVDECTDDGYRKVFVNLKPMGFGNYTLSVDMLVNTLSGGFRVENIVSNIPYNFPAPQNLKLGFAASTGAYNNFHEIRNVVVEVSDLVNVPLPEVENLSAEICEDDQNLFEFNVTLPSENSFVRCVQLFEVAPLPPYNSPATGDVPTTADCGFSDEACEEVCKPENTSIIIPGKGTFSVVLDNVVDLTDSIDRTNAAIRFVPESGFVGTASIFYQVIDNYGLFSEPKEIVIVSNPYPKELDNGEIDFPSCDGQKDGRLFDIEVEDLVPGFEYQWTWQSTSGAISNLGQSGASVSFDATTGIGVFELANINLGTYTLEVRNPSDLGGCALTIPISVNQELGTPVELESDEIEVCEGTPAILKPYLDNVYNPAGVNPTFKWYRYSDRTEPLSNGQTFVVNGATVTVVIDATGQLTLTGLPPANDTNPQTYEFFVEVDYFDSGNPDIPNFCPFIGLVEAVAKVTVFPALKEDLTVVPDWCRDNAGEINLTITGGNGPKTFTLFDETGTQIGSSNNSGAFAGLLPGDYVVEVESSAPVCLLSIPATIEGPVDKLSLTEVDRTPTTCGLDNGSFEFTVSGGTPKPDGTYEVLINGLPLSDFTETVTISGSGENLVKVSDLAEGTYAVVIKDANNCEITQTFILTAQILPEYTLSDLETCLNETADIIPVIVNPGTPIANPVFRWYKDAAATQEILNGTDAGLQMTFDVNSGSGNLSISNFGVAGTYTFYLKPEILNACELTSIPVEVTVYPIPAPDFESVDVSCFSGSDGIIKVTAGGSPDFTYTIQGFSNPYNTTDNQFEDLQPGTYTILVANSVSGCEAEFSVTVGEPDELLIDQDVVINPSCGEDNGSMEFNLLGGTPKPDGTYEVLIDGLPLSDFTETITISGSGENLVKVSDLAEGTYAVVIKDANNCEITQTFDLTAQILPEYSLSDLETCLNETAEITPVIVNQGTPSANPVFRWYKDAAATQEILNGIDTGLQMTFDVNSGGGNLLISNFGIAGTYTFYLKPEILNACELTPIPVTITVIDLPEVSFEVIDVTCFSGINGEIKLLTGGGPNFTFTLNTGTKNNTGNFTGLPAGTYQVTIANAEGCEVMEVMVIEQPALLQIQKIEQTDPTCGDSNGEIVFEISGGTPSHKILVNGDSLSKYKSQINGNQYTVQELAPGTYSVSVSDANNCSITSNGLFTLVNNEGVNVNSQPIFDEICESGTAQLVPQLTTPTGIIPGFRWYYDSAATREIIHNSSPATDGKIYQISGTSVLSIQNLTPGTYNYYLRITGPGICTQITEATVTVTDPVLASVEAESITCFGDSDGQITVKDFAGGNGIYEFSINGTDWQTSPVFSNLAANTYQVRVRDSSGSNGCVLVIDTVVEGPSGLISANTPDLIRASCGLDNGAVRNLQISGGWGNYTFEWRKGNATTGQLLSQGTLTGIEDLSVGIYYLTVTDEKGCAVTFNYTVGESSDPVYKVVPPVNSCYGTPISIRPIHLAPNPSLPPAAATEVRWYKDPNQIGLISDGPDAVTPSVIYTIDDTNWINPELNIENLPVGTHDFYFYVVCTGQEIKIEITVFETPEMVFEETPVTCFGESNGKIKAVSGQDPSFVYQLYGGNNLTLAQLEALNLTAGSYTLSVVTPAGCPQTLQLEITSPSAPLQLQNLSKIDPGCGASNGKIKGQIQGGWAPYTIQIIKNGSPANQITVPGPTLAIDGLSVGTYSLVVTDSRGCVVSSAIFNLVDGPTQVLVQDQTICAGELVTFIPQLDPQVPVATYTWSFDLAGSNVITSSQTPAPDGRTYQISPAGVLTIKGLSTSSQPYQFYVKADGSGVCPGFIAVPKVLVTDSPSATVNVVNAVCFGDGGSLTVNASGGDGTYTYSLDGVNFQTSNVFQVPAGLYDLTVKSGAACLFELPAIQVQGPSAALTFNELKAINSTCNLDNGEISFNIKGGYGNYQVRTFKNNTSIEVSDADANGNFVVNGLGIGVYSFEVIDSSGCTLKLSNALNLIEEPSQITVNDAVICEGETGILKPAVNSNSPDLSFTWYSDAEGKNPISSGTSADVTYKLDANGQLSVAGLAPRTNPYTYYVLATGVGICGIAPVPATIKVGALPQLRVSNPSIVCDPNGTVDLTLYIEGYNPQLYDYTVKSPLGNNLRTDEIKSVSVSGSFVVKMNAKGSACFTPEQRILVLISEKLLVADYDYAVELKPGQLLTNQDVNIGEEILFNDQSLGDVIIWSWDFGDGNTSSSANPKHSYGEKGTYVVKLTTIDKIGCMSEFVRVIQVFDDYLIEIPNAFTPNRTDGKNNYFRPYFRGIATMRLLIFNTWGNFIFESTELETQGWDGYYNGVMSPNGNYVYKAEFETRGGLKVTRTGVFLLID